MNELRKRFSQKKLTLAFLLVGMSIVGVGAMCSNDEPKKGKPAEAHAQAAPMPAPAAKAEAPVEQFSPELATQFVRWWAGMSMDYTPQTAQANHKQAFDYMRPDAAMSFRSCFWTPAIEHEILTGNVSAAFQPVACQAEAVNPDQSIVVGLTGTLVMQPRGGAPVTEQIAVDYLVKKDADCIRVYSLYNRSTIAQPEPQPQPVAVAPQASGYDGYSNYYQGGYGGRRSGVVH
jgi:hypothetical protein